MIDSPIRALATVAERLPAHRSRAGLPVSDAAVSDFGIILDDGILWRFRDIPAQS